jgi:hypothetical protein
MMVGWVVYTWERPDTAEMLARRKPNPADEMFDRLDRNGDDVITPNEIPEQFKPLLMLQGIKVPERITREEFGAVFEEMRKRFQKPKAKPDDKDKKPADAPPTGASKP